MIENTYNRYFPLGETRRAFSHGKVRTFFPEVTEVSHGATAVCNWLSTYRETPTAEALQKCLRDQFLSHPRGGWTEATRVFLSSGSGLPSQTPDWAAVTRVLPIASFAKEDLFRALDLAEACVRATCADEDTVMMAKALTHGVYMARHGSIAAEIFTTLEMQSPSARLVTEAAVKAVIRSDSWEDAVRKAVAFGGPSNALAGIAGGLAEALYGGVTPTVVGKLFPYIPTDIARQIEAFEKVPDIQLGPSSSPYQSITRDALTVFLVGRTATAIVPEDRADIRRTLQKSYPEVSIISPKEKEAFLARYRESRSGTYVQNRSRADDLVSAGREEPCLSLHLRRTRDAPAPGAEKAPSRVPKASRLLHGGPAGAQRCGPERGRGTDPLR